jgi:hypothetical protein
MKRFSDVFNRATAVVAVGIVLLAALSLLSHSAGSWTEFWRLNSSRQIVPLYDVSLDGKKLWGINLDTLAAEKSLWLGHYGTRVDSSGRFFFPFPISNDFGQGWAGGTSPWCNIVQDSNTILNVQLERGAAFGIDRGSGLPGEPGFRVYRMGADRDSFWAVMSAPMSVYRTSAAQPTRVGRNEHVPFAVFSLGGDTLIATISDTDTISPFAIYNRAGELVFAAGKKDFGKIAERETVRVTGGHKMLSGKPLAFFGNDGVNYGNFYGNSGYGYVWCDGSFAVQSYLWAYGALKVGMASNMGFITSADTVGDDSLYLTLGGGRRLQIPMVVIP